MDIHSLLQRMGSERLHVFEAETITGARNRIIRREGTTAGASRAHVTRETRGAALGFHFEILNSAFGGSPVKATVTVELKSGVLDPQGKAIQHSLEALGFAGVEDVRVGKVFRITLKEGIASRAELEARVSQMSEKLLANMIVENYAVKIED